MQIDQPQRTLTRLQKMILKLAGRPLGLSNTELQEAAGVTASEAASALHCSARAGRTLSAQHPKDKDRRMRYFVSRDDAEAWQSGPTPARVERKHPPKLSAIGEPVKSLAKQPGPQLRREKAPPEHAWRPEARHTAGASKMASNAPSLPTAAEKITRGPSPEALGAAGRYYVDPATVRGPFSAIGVGRDVETGAAWGVQA